MSECFDSLNELRAKRILVNSPQSLNHSVYNFPKALSKSTLAMRAL